MPMPDDRKTLPERSDVPYKTEGANGGLVSSPDINKSGDPQSYAIRDAGQAKDVVNTIMQAGRNRSIIYARIADKLNSSRPLDQTRLEAEGLGWRQNVSTRVMTSITERVWPRFTQAVAALKYFTNSSLSDKWQNSTEKSEEFRKGISNLIRQRPGWNDLLENITMTNAVYGFEVVAALDENSWWPKAYNIEDIYLPDGCPQIVGSAQVVVLHEKSLPHELFERIKDREEAEKVGWVIDNTIKQINLASPDQLRDMLSNGGTTEMWYVQARRDLTLGASYMAGSSVISVYNLLVQEVDGTISHYKLAGDSLDVIFSKDRRFKTPEEAFAFFSYERGNGRMHGSKGIGRAAYDLAGMLDRSRNELVDRAIMSGKILVQGDVKRLHTFKMSVIGSTCIIPNGWQVLEHRLDGNPEPYLQLDSFFSGLLDNIVGNVSPPQLGGASEAFRSSASWQLLAARESEGKDSKILRFMEQFVRMVQMLQTRICNPSVVDDDAKEFKKKMLEIMTDEEFDEIANSPVAETVVDLTSTERQMVVALAQEKAGNPLYNARQLQVEDVTARLGADFANRVILPTEDPTEESEQTRLQLLEITLLGQGQPVPVSPRDNDEIHLAVLLPATEQLAGQVMSGQMDTVSLEAMIAHVSEHVNSAQAKGVPKEVLAPATELVKKAGAAIAQLKELDAQAQELAAQDAEVAGEAAPAEAAPPPLQ